MDFFIHLFDRLGLATATIHTYKAAILSALGPRQSFTMSQLATLNKLLKSFHKRKPPKPSPVLDGDIGVVLKSFSLPGHLSSLFSRLRLRRLLKRRWF